MIKAAKLAVEDKEYKFFPLSSIEGVDKLPFSLKILAENLLRNLDNKTVSEKDLEWFSKWDPANYQEKEIAYRPARVLMQDFTGVPAIVDLASMRDAMEDLGGDPNIINPLQPAELVIDHSVQVDNYGKASALDLNTKLEYHRNKERYQFLKWGQKAFSNFKVVPPGTGIVHQVNLEYLARVIFTSQDGNVIYPDTVVGTDSHTTMVNGLGVLGWGVGGIEAEAALLGQPVSMLVPKVVGVKLTGHLQEGITATDLVLRIVEILREHQVVGKFVEFYGEALQYLSLADRATIANMAPEYGATCGIFPVDQETLNYLKLSNRAPHQIKLVEAYYRAQGMYYDSTQADASYNENVELNLSTIVPSMAGPKRPQDRISLNNMKQSFEKSFKEISDSPSKDVAVTLGNEEFKLSDGAIVIAAITSCTNTSNPSVMLSAGLVAKKANALGITTKPWVKSSLAPGSKVVTKYLEKSGLDKDLESLNFYNVGYGCTTCIGNSGPLLEPLATAVKDNNLTVCGVLSGNRNFEGRVHPQVKMNYLASPPLVVAYAIAGRMDIDIINEPLSTNSEGKDIYLKDIWPTRAEVQEVVEKYVDQEHFQQTYSEVFLGEQNWIDLDAGSDVKYQWTDSSYVRKSPFFDNITMPEEETKNIKSAKVLAFLGDSVTTDHISPAGSIKADSPAGDYLKNKGVEPNDFNSYGSRRGNHEVMMRGTFANIRLKNQLLPGTEGGVTLYSPDNQSMSIYDVAMKYQQDETPVMIMAGKEYGTGSSRDWAAKGSKLLGIKVVLAESFERIHRTNLVSMGILPLQFLDGENSKSLKLSGFESYDINNIRNGESTEVTITATDDKNNKKNFTANVRIDTPQEIKYYQNGGILRYVLRQLAK